MIEWLPRKLIGTNTVDRVVTKKIGRNLHSL